MGSGFRSFAFGEVLTSANVQNYLMDQAVTVFAGTAARGSAITSPETGMVSYRTDGTADSKRQGFEFYDGSGWVRMIPAATSAGLVCIQAETSFSAVSTITVDNIFTSSYTNYVINLAFTAVGGGNLDIQFRVGGVTATSNYNDQALIGANTTTSAVRATSQSSGTFMSYGNTIRNCASLTLFGPQLASMTNWLCPSGDNYDLATAPVSTLTTGNHSTATAYDGFIITASGATTITGAYTIYGYAKTV